LSRSSQWVDAKEEKMESRVLKELMVEGKRREGERQSERDSRVRSTTNERNLRLVFFRSFFRSVERFEQTEMERG